MIRALEIRVFRVFVFMVFLGLLIQNQKTNAGVNKINNTVGKDSLKNQKNDFAISGTRLIDLPGKSLHDSTIQKLIYSAVASCVPLPSDLDSQVNKDGIISYQAIKS